MTAKWQYKEAYEAALVTARELRAENTKLQASNEVIAEDHAALCEHNAKLWELVRELWTYAEQELDCDETCSYGAVCDWKDCVLTRRMRELGVEVDG